MEFKILSEISNVENIAVQGKTRDRKRLVKKFGEGRWRKRKGVASVRLADGSVVLAELHWYEASGIGRKAFKIKRILS